MTNKSVEVQISDQYQQVAGAYIKMFEALSPRTALLSNLWRFSSYLKGKYNGTGTCLSWDRRIAIGSYQGPAENHLIELADQRNAYRPHTKTASLCTYHSQDGCVLDSLRPPSCLRHIDDRDELKERFNIYGDRLSQWIGETLEQVMLGETDEKDVETKVYQIDQLTAYISTFPILSEAEQMKDRLEEYWKLLKSKKARSSAV